MKLKKSLIAFAGCAALLGSTLAYAQAADRAVQNNGRGMLPAVQQSGPAALAERLGLAPEQTQKIQQVQEESAQNVQAIVMDEGLAEKRQALAKTVLNVDSSNGDIKDKVEEVNDIQKKISFEMAKSRHAAFMVLTEAQQEQFKVLVMEKVQGIKGHMMEAQDGRPQADAVPQDVPASEDASQGDVASPVAQ